MASNLACVGLAVADDQELHRLTSRTVRRSRLLGRSGGVAVRRWEDASGARLVFAVRFGSVLELLPTYAAPRAAKLSAITDANDEVCVAAVLDAQGEQVTAAALELEERRLLDDTTRAGGPVSIVALGQSVVVFEDAAEFERSIDRMLDPAADPADPAGPPRMASESFLSMGSFRPGAETEAIARLNGVVLHSERRVNALTRQPFVVSRVRTAGFEAHLCLSGAEHPNPLRPGQIVAGRVFMTGTMTRPGAAPVKRRWLSRRVPVEGPATD